MIDIVSAVENKQYNCLTDLVIKYKENKKYLYYSLVLYEQKKEYENNPNTNKEHIKIWKEEKESAKLYKNFLTKMAHLNIPKYPVYQFSIECTTVCCAHCKNCTHENLIMSYARKNACASKDDIFYRTRKAKLLSKFMWNQCDFRVDAVGLGEPFCHPDMIDILQYMHIFFKDVRVTTNAYMLTEEKARELVKIIKNGGGGVTISLCYFNKGTYEREIGMNYDIVLENIKRFLQIRREEHGTNIVKIHIFDNNYNSAIDRENFAKTFNPLLQRNDMLVLLPYVDLAQNGIKGTYKNRKKAVPCRFLWETITIDIDGNIFPCCMGLWKKYDKYLCVGTDTDSLPQIIENIILLRKKQINGEFGSCLECATLWQINLKYYPNIYYKLRHYENKKLDTLSSNPIYIKLKMILNKINKQ